MSGVLGVPARHDASAVGLLGGSFNPAHAGHREISLEALRRLSLDAVWWLVSPGNPLKDPADNMPYEARLAEARRVADHSRIVVSDFERRKNLQYTIDTVRTLTDLWPDMRFVWLMGADSLAGFHLWRDWRAIAETLPIAVFSRPGHERAALDAPAAQALSAFKVDPAASMTMVQAEPPVWTFFDTTRNPMSATAIRAKWSQNRNDPEIDPKTS